MSNVNSVRLETVEFSVAEPTNFGQIVPSFFPPFYFVFLFSLSSDDTLKVKMATTKYQSLIFIINCVCVLKM